MRFTTHMKRAALALWLMLVLSFATAGTRHAPAVTADLVQQIALPVDLGSSKFAAPGAASDPGPCGSLPVSGHHVSLCPAGLDEFKAILTAVFAPMGRLERGEQVRFPDVRAVVSAAAPDGRANPTRGPPLA